MSEHQAIHDTFTLERTYRASPERVFAAWVEPDKKLRWYAGGEGWEVDSYECDAREGGFERTRFRAIGGPDMTNTTYYHDVIPDRRLVCSYDMTMSGARFSVSLATLELEPSGTGTKLRYTEQVAFFGGVDHSGGRREGCAQMLEKLAKELGEGAATAS